MPRRDWSVLNKAVAAVATAVATALRAVFPGMRKQLQVGYNIS